MKGTCAPWRAADPRRPTASSDVFASTLLSALLLCAMHSATASADTYTYDAAGRLTQVTYDDGSSISYSYDANGNLLQRSSTEALDLVPPDITLLGEAAPTLTVGDSFSDPGATAVDAVDGDLTTLIVVQGSVDTASAGTYTLNYTVTDAAGNSAEITRTVTVYDPPQLIDDDGFLYDAQIQSPTAGLLATEQVQLYRAYSGALGRLPDRGGYEWWLNEIREGRHTLESMAAGFIFSDEFRGYADTDLNGTISNEELIRHMYINVFGREPDAGGLAWWIGQLESGAKTQARAFIEMTQSNEYVMQTLTTVAAFAFL